MNDEYINKITLQYLLNPNIVVDNKSESDDLEKDMKFYRKRICQITKDMSKKNYINDNLKLAFYNYVSQLIYFFKQIDLGDIYQTEYDDLSLNSNILDNSNNLEKSDNELIDDYKELLTINSAPTNLNSFVKKINIKQNDNIIPLKKDINIKDPILRKKGIQKE